MLTSFKFRLLLAAVVTAVSLLPLRAADPVTRSDPPAAKSKVNRGHETAADKAAPQQRVEINTATQEELEALPGIGPVTAKAIMSSRPFKNINELTNVSGISQAKFASLKPLVTVRPHRAAVAADGARSVRPAPPTAVGRPTPAEKGSANSAIKPSSTRSAGQRIDLNTATKEELENLPGIGPVRAQAIIDGRPYASPEDVMKVKGIKEGIYNEIKDQISVK